MKIIPNRSMRLDGKHVERAKPVDVTDAEAENAIRHGWAVKAAGKADDKAAGKADDKVEQ